MYLGKYQKSFVAEDSGIVAPALKQTTKISESQELTLNYSIEAAASENDVINVNTESSEVKDLQEKNGRLWNLVAKLRSINLRITRENKALQKTVNRVSKESEALRHELEYGSIPALNSPSNVESKSNARSNV